MPPAIKRALARMLVIVIVIVIRIEGGEEGMKWCGKVDRREVEEKEGENGTGENRR